MPAVRVRELAGAVASGARTVDLKDYADQGVALQDLRNGQLNGVLVIPPDFSRRALSSNQPHVALISDNTDNFVAATLSASLAMCQPSPVSRAWSRRRPPSGRGGGRPGGC